MSDTPTKICHISTVHQGVELRIVRKELGTLAKCGFESHLILPATDADIEETKLMGISTQSPAEPGSFGRIYRSTILALVVAVKAYQTGATVIHFHDPELIPVGLALQSIGKKVVMDVHEDFAAQILEREWLPTPVRGVLARSIRFLELFGARRFEAVVAAVPSIEDIFQEHARRVKCVANFPLTSEIESAPIDVPWQHRTKIAYVGGITRIRGLFEMIDVLPKVDTHLQLGGKFAYAADRDEAIKRPGWQYVDEYGWVNRDTIRELLAKSFVGLSLLHPTPNYLITQSTKLFEYMSGGLPVVASNFPIWKKFVEETDSGKCVDPLDVDQIAEAILFLKDNPERARDMGQNGRNAVLSKYNWEQEGETLVSLYRNILDV